MRILFEILIIFLLIFLNGFFALAEIAIVSARKTKLKQLANEGSAGAGLALNLATHPSNFLSAVQIGITLVGVLAGAFGGATIAEHLAETLNTVPALATYSDALAITVVVILITYLSLIIGELVPKHLALTNPERFATATASPLGFLLKVTRPLVAFLSWSTQKILKLLRVPETTEPPISEEEIKILLEAGTEAGVFEETEQDMVEGIFHLGNRPISAIMTPRTEIVWLDIDDREEIVRKKITESDRSVFPVGKGDLDEVLGVVEAKDLLARSLQNEPINLQALSEKVLFILESTPALRAVEKFKRSGLHIAMIIDEHGSIQGLVTLNDILEAIIGDISLTGEPQIKKQGDHTWIVDGIVPIDEFKRQFEIDYLPDEGKGYYHTMGGFIMVHLGRIPTINDVFLWQQLSFRVTAMDGRRVAKIEVKRTV